MDRPENMLNRRGRAQGAAAALAAAALTASAFVADAPAAHAQSRGKSAPYIVEVASVAQTGDGGGSRASMTRGTGTANLPDAARSVMQRAATMLQAAEARRGAAPYGARQSYQAAASAFRQALSTGRYAATGSGASLTSSSAGILGLPVSSTQVAEDIRVLKTAMNGATPAQRDALQRITSLYATGAKEYFIGQLRDALFSSDNATGGAIVIRGQRQPSNPAATGIASSALTTGDTVTPRGAQTAGGVVQGDGSVLPVQGAAPAPGPPGSNIAPSGVNVTQTPPVGVTPIVPGTAVSPLSPTAPVVVPAAPVEVPVPVPATPPDAPVQP